ncbi:MAG: septal ring lytic transglycosylase RlpA family protein [Hyphomicrobiaceae bacterium]
MAFLTATWPTWTLAARAAVAVSAVAVSGCAGSPPSLPAAGFSDRAGKTSFQTTIIPPAPVSVEIPAVARVPVPPAPTAGTPTQPKAAKLKPSDPVAKVKGVYKIGKPYEIAGKTYAPKEDPTYDAVGIASWYGAGDHGKQTANGELFDVNALTGAHPTLPLPSYVYVTNLGNGRTIMVRLNDRGPFKPGRIVDVSKAAAEALGFHKHGLTQVRVRYAGPAPLEPDDTRERRFLAAQVWHRSLHHDPDVRLSSLSEKR